MPIEMVSYAIYADRFGWTPSQVDGLTIEQDDWLIPTVAAMDNERERRRRREEAEAERQRKAKAAKGL